MEKILLITIIVTIFSYGISQDFKPINNSIFYGGSETLENSTSDNNFGVWSIKVYDLSSK